MRSIMPRTTRRPGQPTARRTFAGALALVGLAGLVSGCGGAAPTAPPPVPHPPAEISAGNQATENAQVAEEAADPGTEAGALTTEDVSAWLDGMLPAALSQSDIAGATIAVVHDGQVLTTRGYGHADTGTSGGEPKLVDPEETAFRAASVAKVVTATAVMQLVEAGELDLDTDIDEYLDFEVPRSFEEPVTLRHLLSHSAGFEDRYRGLLATTGTDLRTYLAADPPEQIYAPGTTPAYSNYGIGLAGYIVQHASGRPFEQYIDEHITAPLQMTSSTFAQPLPEDLAERVASSYPDVSAGPAAELRWNASPAAALTTTAADMATFMLAHLQGLDDVRLLEPETLDQMHGPALGPDSLGALTEGPQMALGFWQEDRNGHHIVGHGGDMPDFHSHLQIYPDEDTGIFVSVNSSGRDAADSLVLRESVLHGFTDRYFPRTSDLEPAGVDEQTAREHAQLLAGTYDTSRVFDTTFMSLDRLGKRVEVSATEDGRLVFDPAGLPPMLLEEVSPWEWREVGGEQTLVARVVDGQVEALGHEAGTSLLPVDPVRSFASVAVFIGSVLVLLLALLTWPIGALTRRVLGAPRQRFGSRTVRTALRVALLCTVTALLGWAGVMVSLNSVIPPAPLLRGLQLLLLAGLLGVIPGVWRMVQAVPERAGLLRVAALALVPLAFLGIGWFAVTFGFLAPSISY